MTLHAYFDGSGKENDHPIVTVGGYLADDLVCRAIEADWVAATEGKTFHLADFDGEARKLGSASWSERKRAKFLKKLCAVVNRNGVTIISASVDVSEYRQFVSSAVYPKLFGPPYSMVAYLSLQISERMLLKTGKFRERLVYVFEKGEREHEVRQAIADYESRYPKNNSLRSLDFLPKHTTYCSRVTSLPGQCKALYLQH